MTTKNDHFHELERNVHPITPFTFHEPRETRVTKVTGLKTGGCLGGVMVSD